MAFDYDADTRRHYQSDAVAREYHAAFASRRGWRSLAHRVVAKREIETIERLLTRVPHRRVIDIPCGTGKLAGLFARLRCEVRAFDISPNMLQIAQEEYERAGVVGARFQVADASRVAESLDAPADVVVCLRLLHRVPADVQGEILRGLAKASRHAIVSFGVETRYHRIRRHLRHAIFGGSADALCFESLATIRGRCLESFEIVDVQWIMPFVSQEIVFLLKPRAAA